MIERKTAVGLSLLCAFVFCAFAAPSAMALHGTTASTCLPVKVGAAFADEHCTIDKEGGEGWVHQEIAEGVKTQLSVTNNETSTKTIASKLKATVGGMNFEATAAAFQNCEAEKTRVQNTEANEKMFTGGLFCGEYTKVTVNQPAKCSVLNSTVKLNEGGTWISHVVVNPMTLKEEMWLEFAPEAGKPFATFEITGGECPLNGKKVEVTGTAETTATFPTSALEGATLKFTTKTTGETLQVEGKKAEFEGTFTPRMRLEAEKASNPIVLTTTDN